MMSIVKTEKIDVLAPLAPVQRSDIQQSLVRVAHAGQAVRAIRKCIVEINIARESGEPFFGITRCDEDNLTEGMALLAWTAEQQAYRVARLLGLKDPC